MSIESRRNSILEAINAYNLLPDESDVSAITKIQLVAEGHTVAVEKYSRHQHKAAQIAQKSLGGSVDEILKAYATMHPPLFKGNAANDNHYDNWAREHSLSESTLARVWVENSEILYHAEKLGSPEGGSKNAEGLLLATQKCTVDLKKRVGY